MAYGSSAPPPPPPKKSAKGSKDMKDKMASLRAMKGKK